MHIIVNGLWSGLHTRGRQRCCNLMDRGHASNVIKQETRHTLQKRRILKPLSEHHILQQNGVIEPRQIIPDLAHILTQRKRIRKGTIPQIVLIMRLSILAWSLSLHILPKRQRLHLNLDIATRKECRQLTRQKVSIGSCDVDVHILFCKQPIHQLLELRYTLNLIQKDIAPALLLEPRSEQVPDLPIRLELSNIWVLKVKRNNLFRLDARSQQALLIELQKSRFATAPDPCDNLDHLLVFPAPQPIQKIRTINHDATPKNSVNHRSLKLISQYQNLSYLSSFYFTL